MVSGIASVSIDAMFNDNTPFDGGIFVFTALPAHAKDEIVQIDSDSGSIPIPVVKKATLEKAGKYSIKLIKNSRIMPPNSRYVVFAEVLGKDPQNCATFIADSDEISISIEVRR
mgnify:CR=1 FL=1